MTQSLHDAVADELRTHGVVNTSCVIGVSGGIDSSTLLECCHTVAHDCGLTIHVVHVNYGLRAADSDADEELVRARCNALNIPCQIVHARPHDMPMFADKGLEATAREVRYEAFVAYAEEHKIRFVLTGHTLDDHAETVLMHLARGSGAAGLAGIPRVRPLAERVTVVRPLRGQQRSDIVDYARQHHVRWRNDASNDTDMFQRNRVRHLVMPALREAVGAHVLHAIDRSSDHLRNLSLFLSDYVTTALDELVIRRNGMTVIDVLRLQQYHPALINELLRHGLSLSYDDTLRVAQLVNAEVGSVATIHGNRRVLRDRNTLIMQLQVAEAPFPEVGIHGQGQYVAGSRSLTVSYNAPSDVTLHRGSFVAYVDAASIVGNLVWRQWSHGDRFQPFGMQGHVLVSDLLTNARVPHQLRNAVRVLCDDEGVVWVCGHRQAERTRVTHATTTVMILTELSLETHA